MTVLEATDLAKTYTGGDGGVITVLDGVNLQVARGEMVAIVGASGAGKSTLLHLLGALDRPTRGTISIAAGTSGGTVMCAACRTPIAVEYFDIGGHAVCDRCRHRMELAADTPRGVVPLLIAGWDSDRAYTRAEELLSRVGLTGRMTHRPGELSGGEQQRTAVARALAIDPSVLLADEPSGNLDHANSERLHDLFVELSRDLEIAMVVVTHNRSLASRADRALLLEDGRLTDTGVGEVLA